MRAHHYYSRYVERKLALSELELQLTSAQLQALKMQLHPHFLFNSLHSLMGLIQEDLAAARRMLFQLQHAKAIRRASSLPTSRSCNRSVPRPSRRTVLGEKGRGGVVDTERRIFTR